ncbi:MAG: hypothetical protein ABI680_10015 [Chthoniobacteraceae bacterium]
MKPLALLLVVFGIASAAEREERKSVGTISSINEISHIHITHLLLSRGIASVIVGSVWHAILVPPDKAAEASPLLRADAPKRAYTVWLPDTDEIVGAEPEPKVLASRISVATALKQVQFGPRTDLGRFLRSKDIARLTAKYPFIISLRVVERQYLATPTELRTGYDLHLDLQKSLRDRDDDFGGWYQVYNRGKRIEYLGGHEGTVAKPE